MMRWADLRGFIDARAPTYWGSTKGVPRDEIAAIEDARHVSLPRIYVDFLGAMGVDAGDLCPFGPSQGHDIHRLRGEPEERPYPRDRYFKVAIEDDRSLVIALDTFLDLAGSDGDDAPLVQFEDIGVFDEEMVSPLGFTLGEQLTRSVFDFFELDSRQHKVSLGVYHLHAPEDVERQLQLLAQQFTRMGVVEVLPRQPHVACFRDDRLSALVEWMVDTDSVVVQMGAADRRISKVAVEQLRENVPGLVLDR